MTQAEAATEALARSLYESYCARNPGETFRPWSSCEGLMPNVSVCKIWREIAADAISHLNGIAKERGE